MCAIFGSITPAASFQTFLGLQSLQHRGQEGSGILSNDSSHQFHLHKAPGLVVNVFSEATLSELRGDMAIGHNRYATTGESCKQNLQPFLAETPFGWVGLVHNGNLTNAALLKKELEARGARFETTTDTEVILQAIVMSKKASLQEALREILPRLEGAYSLLLLTAQELLAVRDPLGYRPLVIGEGEGSFFFASETSGLHWHNVKRSWEIEPGTLVSVDRKGHLETFEFAVPPQAFKRCVFEHVYFARPDSILFGAPVYEVRKALGQRLAEEHPISADIVIPVPDSGVAAALGYSEKSKIPFEMGIVRSHYSGRTFIEPAQVIRDLGVKKKLSAISSAVKGRRVVVVDDSLVRGTTSKQIVKMLRDQGASEVHLRLSSPPIVHPCHYGIDTPTHEELIAHNKSLEAIRKFIQAESLGFLSRRALLEVASEFSRKGYCESCFST